MHHQLQQVDRRRRRRRRRSSSCRNVVAMSTTDYYPYNGKVLLAAVIFLSIVIAFVLLLHAYARWLLSRRPVVVVVRDVPREPPPPPRRSSATLPGRASEARLSSVSGLDAAVVAALPVFVYGEQGEELECVVCLGPMAAGETGRLLPGCRHAFHAGCIDVWFMSRSTCPICRAEVKADVLPGSEAEAGPTAAGCDQEVVVLLDELAGGDVDEGIMGSGGNGALGVAELMVSVPSPSSAMEDQIIVKGSEPSCSVSSIATSCGCSLKRMLSSSRSSH